MTIGASHDTTFSRAAQRVLEHLSTTSGLGSWAVCRADSHGSHTLVVDDTRGSLRAHVSLDAAAGQGAPFRIAVPITFPDGQPFGELVGFDDRDPSIDLEHASTQARVFAILLGALAAAEATLARERRVTELSSGLSDPLTGLATRQGWEQRLRRDEQFCREFGEPAAVMLIELHGLERSNELHGHSAGDEHLRIAGTVVREVLGDRHFGAHVGGNRLGAVMIGVSDHEVTELERVTRQALETSEVAATIGIGRRRPETGFDGAISMADADIEAGQSARESATADADKTAALIVALECGAIRAYFQPIVDLRTGTVVTVEALARWHSPDGIREPDQFLPLLQQAGLLGALFDRILDDGLEKLVEFRQIVPDLQLAVNFEFDTKPVNSLHDAVLERLAHHGLPPQALSLELSERQTFELPPEVRDELFAIAEMGVQLMLDDFGTGFASLETLTTLPVSGVKLDRRFTGQVVNGERESIVVKAMIALATETGLTVIAEGIETQLQCDRLVRMGCRLGQGYLFAVPQPADSMATVLSAPLVSTF
ncbi:MAG TPA: GGDEF domain-containing phosphodiesterase [Ilumatobacteraceae bacterium]|nr:GGDEF domain-containing phosphodiesterase [Ilumatobacteraceae bacterium]HRA84266.1 GGDEF domain-containing phosphodiesterase [Ilumatobacteraceae bacterium]